MFVSVFTSLGQTCLNIHIICPTYSFSTKGREGWVNEVDIIAGPATNSCGFRPRAEVMLEVIPEVISAETTLIMHFFLMVYIGFVSVCYKKAPILQKLLPIQAVSDCQDSYRQPRPLQNLKTGADCQDICRQLQTIACMFFLVNLDLPLIKTTYF